MHKEAEGLMSLVEDLRNRDIDKMAAGEAQAFKAWAMSRFAIATAQLPTLLLPDSAKHDRMIWDVSAAEPYSLEWIGTFKLRATDLIEANLGQPKLRAMAAALWPDVEVLVELMGDFHCEGGLQSYPNLQIVIRAADGPGSDALEAAPPTVCARIDALSRRAGLELCVRTVESAIDDQVNPSSLASALVVAVESAREVAEIEGTDIAEAIEVRLTLPSGSGLQAAILVESLEAMGQLFDHCDTFVADARRWGPA